ncbi:MAG: hypothetical protein ACO1SV_07515 [Fimbriimonas sp.]
MIITAIAIIVLPPLPRWEGRPVGSLPAEAIGFARLPGLGRCALTADGRAWYFAGDRLRHRPAELGPRVSATRADFGDVDGDGIDDLVRLMDDGTVYDYAWSAGGFRAQDRLRLPQGYVYADPILVPDADRGRAMLLVLQGPPAEGNPFPDRILAYRKVEDRWEPAWTRPLFGRSGLPVRPNWTEWEAAGGGQVLVGTNNGDFPYERDTVCVRVTGKGLNVRWTAHEEIATGKRATRSLDRLPGQAGGTATGSAVFGESQGLMRNELVEWSRGKLRPLATIPASTSAWWETSPGKGYLIDGKRVLAPAKERNR